MNREEHNMNMDVKTLVYFKKVAELEHMSKAAEELYISQAHLSRIITALETEIGVPLFDRVGRGIKLNNCGKMYYEYVLKIFALLNESVNNVRDEYLRERAQLVVGTNTSTYLPKLFSIFIQEKPSVSIKQYSFTRKKLLQYLNTEKIDFNILCPPSNGLNLISIPIHKEPGIIIYPDNHWLKDRKKVSMKELIHENFVGVNLGYGVRDAIEIMCEKNNFKPNYVIETADTALIKQYIKEGLGIGIVPKAITMGDPYYKDHYCDCEEDIYGIVALEWRKERILSEDDIAFCDTVLKYFHTLSKIAGTNFTEEPPEIMDYMNSIPELSTI